MRAQWLSLGLFSSFAVACASEPTSGAPDTAFYDATSDVSAADVGVRGDSGIAVDAPTLTPDAGTDGAPPVVLVYPTPTCTNANEIPLPFTDPQSGPHTYGEVRCYEVGAVASSITGDWPDTSTARRPFVYVKVGGTGDGSSPSMPLPTIAAGLAALTAQGNGTLILSGESHMLDASATIASDISILGIAGRTQIAAASVAPAFDVNPSAASSASLTISGVEFDGAAGFTGSMLHAGAGATLVLRDVIIDRTEHGISADGAVVDAVGVTIRNATGRAVSLALNGDGRLRSILIRGGSHGIFADGAAVSATMVGVFDAAIGVAVMSDTPVSATLDRVATLSAGKIGIGLSGAGVSATAQHLMVAGTQYGATDGAGIGLLVRDRASLALDVDIATDALQGRGSQVRANDATGVVVDTGAHAEMHGLLLGSNGQSGIVIQNGAVVGNVAQSFFQDNAGTGLVLSTGGSIAGLLCDGFVSNRTGTMHFGSTDMRMQDGAEIVPGAGGRFSMRVENSLFYGHEGFGLLCDGIDAMIVDSTFTNNNVGWALFNGTPTTQGIMTSDNRTAAPMENPGGAPGAVTSSLGLR